MIENFLNHDFDAMKRGELGYPLIMTAFGAIELFGALTSPETFQPSSKAGRAYFLGFWANHVYPDRTDAEAIGGDLYTLVRNGIAHSFFPKGDIGVMGPNRKAHLTIDPQGDILLDAHALADDVIGAYERTVRPLARRTDGPVNAATMQSRLDEMCADERIAPAEARLRRVLQREPAAD
jgi:hypothetical protein